MPEEFKINNLNNKNEKFDENQVDNFPKTTKLLDTKLKDKKDKIQTVLKDDGLKRIFEDILSNPEKRQKLINELLENDNTEEVILADLPEGYAYNISTNDVVKTEIKKTENYTGAMITDQKGEEADQNEEEADQNEEEADQNEEEADLQKNNNIVSNENAEVRSNRAKQAYEDLTKKYPKLVLQVNENLQVVKQQLESDGILNQLRESGYDDQFINDYVTLRTTLLELKSNPTSYEQSDISHFDKLVKNLNNACNIPDTNLNSFSSGNVTQTRHELFNSDIGNDNLIQAKQSNLESSDYKEMFPEMTEEEKVQVYGKFLARFNKRYLDEYNKHLNNNTLNEYRKTDECKQFIQTIENIKTSMDNKTKDLMEELCIISQIKGMYMCMGEGDSFDLNKANEIESENGILTLNGHIDGVDFTIRQNTNDPEARLQTSQKLAKLVDGNMFSVGGKGNFVDSNFILPTQSDIFKLAVESVNSDGALEDADTPAKYVQLMQERFMGRVDNMYEDTKYVHHYMKEQVKGEKIVNDTLGLIGEINPVIINNTALMENITQESNKDLYDFMKILKFNIDNSTDLEKDHFDWCISKIGEIINNYKTNKKISEIYPSEISKYLENDTWTEGTQEERLKLIFDLFNHFNENPIDKSRVGYEGSGRTPINMIINDLYTQLHDKPKEIQEQQVRDKTSNEEHDTAENVLNLGNSSLWPSESAVSVA